MDTKWQTALMLLQTVLFVSVWRRLHSHVRENGPVPGAANGSRIHNRVYAVISLCLLALILSPDYEHLAQQLYYASKFYEYVDIFGVCASGGTIDLHFGFHHLTTPYFAFVRVIHNSKEWKPFAAVNAAHHALMYAYFGGVHTPRPVLPWTGALQLVVGIFVDIQVVREKITAEEGNIWPNVFSGCLLATYLVLSTRELLARGGQGKAARNSRERESQKEK